MEELFELRRYIEQQRYQDALALIAEMEEMSREDKINKIDQTSEVSQDFGSLDWRLEI